MNIIGSLSEFSISIEEIEPVFLKKVLNKIYKGINYFNEEINYSNKLINGIEKNLNKRKFFRQQIEPIKTLQDWRRLKSESFIFSVKELVQSFHRSSQELLPTLGKLIDIALSFISRLNETQNVGQSLCTLQQAIQRRSETLADSMNYLLHRCVDENCLNLMTSEQFNYFCHYISQYGNEKTQIGLKQLFKFYDDQIDFSITIQSGELRLVNQKKSDLPQISLSSKTPKAYLFQRWLPGHKVWQELLPQQFYAVATINAGLNSINPVINNVFSITQPNLSSLYKEIDSKLSQQNFGLSNDLKQCQPFIQSIDRFSKRYSKNSGEKEIIDRLRQAMNRLQQQQQNIQQVMETIDTSRLNRWRGKIANLFGYNPNLWLDRWQLCFQTQKHHLIQQKCILFKQGVAYLTQHLNPERCIWPDPKIVELLRELAESIRQDLEIHQSQSLTAIGSTEPNSNWIQVFEGLNDNFESLTDLSHYFITCIEQEDPQMFKKISHELNGLTINLANEQKLSALINQLCCYQSKQKGDILKKIGQWVQGKELPSSFAEMNKCLMSLFEDDEQHIASFIDLLVKKYWLPIIDSVKSPLFIMVKEYNHLLAEEWIKNYHSQSTKASYDFFNNLLADNICTGPVIIQGKHYHDANTLMKQAKVVIDTHQALADQNPDKDQINTLKLAIKRSMQRENSFLYSVDYIKLIVLFNDPSLTIEFAVKLFNQLLNQKELDKLLIVNDKFYSRYNQQDPLQQAIQYQLAQAIQNNDWDPFLNSIIEAMGNRDLKHYYRLYRFNKILKEPLFAKQHAKESLIANSPKDLIDYYGEAQIPQLIQAIDNFLSQDIETNPECLTLICTYVTPSFVQHFNASSLNDKLEQKLRQLQSHQIFQKEANSLIDNLKHAQQIQPEPTHQDQIILKNDTETIDLIKFCTNIQENVQNLFRQFMENTNPKINKYHLAALQDLLNQLTLWLREIDTTTKAAGCASTISYPHPHFWSFFNQFQLELEKFNSGELLKKTLMEPLVLQFKHLSEEFTHFSQVTSFIVDNIEAGSFTREQHFAKNGLVSIVPSSKEIIKFFQEVKKDILPDLIKPVQDLENFLLGEYNPQSSDQLRQFLQPLFNHHPQPAASIQKLIEVLVKDYLEPRVTDIHSPSYQLLQECQPLLAKKWLEKQRLYVEESLFFLQKILEMMLENKVILNEFSDPLICNGKLIQPTLDNVFQHVRRVYDFSTKETDYAKELCLFIQSYLQHYTNQPDLLEYIHPIVTATKDSSLIVSYGTQLLQALITHQQWMIISVHPFFIAHQNHEALQTAMAKILVTYFGKIGQWHEDYLSIINYFLSKEIKTQLLETLLQTSCHWHPRLDQLIQETNNQILIQASHQQWLQQILTDNDFAKLYDNALPQAKDAKELITTYGRPYLPRMFEMIHKMIATNQCTEAGISLIQSYLTDDNIKNFQLEDLLQQWQDYMIKRSQSDKADDVVTHIMMDLKMKSYESAVSKIKQLINNLQLYHHASEQHTLQVMISDKLIKNIHNLTKELVREGAQQTLAFLECYVIRLLPESQEEQKDQKTALIQFCRQHHPDYYFDPQDQRSFILFNLLNTHLHQFDQKLFTELNKEFPLKSDAIKALRERMISAQISKVRNLPNLSESEKHLINLQKNQFLFFRLDKTFETVLNISAGAFLLYKKMGRSTDALDPFGEFLDNLSIFNHQTTEELKSTSVKKSIKEILVGPYQDGLLSELLELIMKHSTPQQNIECKYLENMIKDESDISTMERYGNLLLTMGNYHQAIECFDQIIKQCPQNQQVHYSKMIAQFHAGKYEAFIQDMPTVLKYVTGTDADQLIYYRGLVYEKLRKFSHAAKDMDYLKKRGFQIKSHQSNSITTQNY